MRIRLTLLLLTTLIPNTAAEDRVALIVIDNQGTPGWKKAHLELFKRLGIDERLKERGQLQYWQTDHASKYRDKNSVRGYALSLIHI